MQQADTSRRFWWRAAEPIPHRTAAHEHLPIDVDDGSAADAALATPEQGLAADGAWRSDVQSSPPCSAPAVTQSGAAVVSDWTDRPAGDLGGVAAARDPFVAAAVTADAPIPTPPPYIEEPRSPSPPLELRLDPLDWEQRTPAACPGPAVTHSPKHHWRSPIPTGRRNQRLAVAAALGLALFATATAITGGVRGVEPTTLQIDRLLAQLGLGIEQVSVSGLSQQSDSDVYAAIGADRTRSLLFFDVTAARRRAEALPWVAEVHIRRAFPARLEVMVRERQPAAIWIDGVSWSLIDATGKVLTAVEAGARPDLIRLKGQGAPEAAAELIAVLDQHRAFAGTVDVFHRIGRRTWQLEFANRTRVHLGPGDIGMALARLQATPTLRSILARPAQLVDMRADGMIAVRPSKALPSVRRRSVESRSDRLPDPRSTSDGIL